MLKKIKNVSAQLHLLTAKDYSQTKMLNKSGIYNIYTIQGTSEINKAYKYKVNFVSDIKLNKENIVNTQVKIVLRDSNHTLKQREIYGQISNIKAVKQAGKKEIYEVLVVSPFQYLYKNREYEIYQEMNVIEIITKVLKRTKLSLDLEVENKLDQKTFPKRETCTQYNQSDAKFIMMLAQEEGFSISFDSKSHKPYKVILSQINEHAKKIEDPIICNYDEKTSFKPSLGISNYYDFEKPSLNYINKEQANLEESIKENSITAHLTQDLKKTTIHDRLEKYKGYIENDIKRYTKLKAIRDYALTQMIIANSSDISADDSHYAKLKNKKEINTIIIKTKLTAKFPNVIDEYKNNTKEKYIFNNQFIAIPAEVLFISQLKVEEPPLSGTQTAIVAGQSTNTTKEENTINIDNKGRIKVLFHFQTKKTVSCYIRLGTLFSGNKWGAQFLPRVNTEVIVDFINGDINKPIITGALYNGDNKIPHSLPESKTQTYIKTGSMPQYEDKKGYNELLFDDKQNQELLSIRAQKDYNLNVNNDSKIKIDNNKKKIIKKDEETIIGNNETTKIKGSDHLNIGANKSETIGGNDTQIIKGTKIENVALGKVENIGGKDETIVGGTQDEIIGGNSSETVGDTKSINVGKKFEIKVGTSSFSLDNKGNVDINCEELILKGAKQIIANGKVIEINGGKVKAKKADSGDEGKQEGDNQAGDEKIGNNQLNGAVPVVAIMATPINDKIYPIPQSQSLDNKRTMTDKEYYTKQIESVKFDKEEGSLFEPFSIIIKTKNIDIGKEGKIKLTDKDGFIFTEDKIKEMKFEVEGETTTIKVDLLKNINDVITLIKDDIDIPLFNPIKDGKIEIKADVTIDEKSKKSEKTYKLDRKLKPNLIPTGYIVQAIRPLGGVAYMEDGLLNIANMEILHEQIFLRNGENIGFLGQDKGLNEDKGDISLYLARKVIKADSNKIWEAVKVVAKERWKLWEEKQRKKALNDAIEKYADHPSTSNLVSRNSKIEALKEWKEYQALEEENLSLEKGKGTKGIKWEEFHLGFNKLTYELFGYNCQAFVEDVLRTYKSSQ